MNFQNIIFILQNFWKKNGCNIIQPINIEVGAGTSHYITMLYTLNSKLNSFIYIQQCKRPSDGRFSNNSSRLQQYYQLQVLLKPSPNNIQKLTIDSMKKIGINPLVHDIKFIHSNWENTTLGAYGLGWEVWCNGMEIIQVTYIQQVGGLTCEIIPGEITYGMERIAMFVQKKDNIWRILWNNKGLTYLCIHKKQEIEYCHFNFDLADIKILKKQFKDYKNVCQELIKKDLVYPSYDYCLKAIHIFNILEARRVLSINEKIYYVSQLKNLTKKCCIKYKKKEGGRDI